MKSRLISAEWLAKVIYLEKKDFDPLGPKFIVFKKKNLYHLSPLFEIFSHQIVSDNLESKNIQEAQQC